MIINIFDGRVVQPVEGQRNYAWTAAAPQDHEVRMVASSGEPLRNIIRRIKEQSEGPGSIWLLRIIAHGDAGRVWLGSEVLDTGSVNAFGELRNYFTPGGRGTAIHACGVASSTSICGDPSVLQRLLGDGGRCNIVDGTLTGRRGTGASFLGCFARITGAIARGGQNTQLADARFLFEGPSVAYSHVGPMVVLPGTGHYARDTVDPFR